MELQLALSLSTCTQFHDPNKASKNRKRSYSNYASESGNEIIEQPRTLPLFLWTNQPNREEEDEDDSDNSSSSSINQIDEEEDDGIVGWPPIKSRRGKMRQNPTVDNECADCHARVSNSMYVKVKMEGVAIARKIDLSIFNSFEHLKEILIGMFGIFQENTSSYKLSYQDRDGDWLLAEDVSWRSFMGSVQRLKLMKSSSWV